MKRYYKGISSSDQSYHRVVNQFTVECSSSQEESYWYYGGPEPYLIAYESTGWYVYDNYSTKVAGPFESWDDAELWCGTFNDI